MGQRDSKFGNRSIGNWVRVVKIVASSFYIFFCHIEVLLWIENSTNMSFRSKYKLQVNCWVFESFFIVINRFDALFQKSLRDVSDGPYNERCVIVSIHASPIIMALLIARACRSRFPSLQLFTCCPVLLWRPHFHTTWPSWTWPAYLSPMPPYPSSISILYEVSLPKLSLSSSPHAVEPRP